MKKTLQTLLLIIPIFCFGQWNLATNYPASGVALPFCFTLSGKAYIGCGYNASYTATVSNNEYDPISNTWSIKSVPPFSARMGAFSFSIGSYGYVGSGSSNGGFTVFTDFWRYDASLDTWTAMAPFPGVGRIEAATFVIGGKGYVISGIRSAGNPADCWEYDPSSNSWTAMNNPPTGFNAGYVTGFTKGNFAYVGIGGFNSSSFNDFWRFDPSSNSWLSLPSLPATPSTRTWCVGGTDLISGKGFVGLGAYSALTNVDFWTFDVLTNTWQLAPALYNFPNALANGRTFNLGGETYVGTGIKAGAVENNIYKFSCSATTMPANLNTGLLAYYPFNSGSIDDFSSNGHDLTNSTTAHPTADRNGNANCAFNFTLSNNEFLDIPTPTFLDNFTTAPFSISLWYQPIGSRPGGNYELLIGRDMSLHCPDTYGQWSVGLYDCRKVVVGFDMSSHWQNSTDPDCDNVLNTISNNWHHVVFVYDGSTSNVYFDGVLDTVSYGPCGFMSGNIGSLFLGKEYNGDLDDIFVYNRALTGAEVTQLQGLGSSCCSTGALSTNEAIPVKDSSFLLYPNPANDFIKIQKNETSAIAFEYKIVDLVGRVVKTGKSSYNEKISIENLKTGNYIIQIETVLGEKMTEKLIKN